MSYIRAHKIGFILFLSLFSLFSTFGRSSPFQQDLSEYEKRLIAITEQITDIRKKISEEEKRKTSVLSRLNSIGLNKTLIKKEIALYNAQMQKADGELITLQKNIPLLEEKLSEEKQSIEKILVTLYKFGKSHIGKQKPFLACPIPEQDRFRLSGNSRRTPDIQKEFGNKKTGSFPADPES